MDDLTKMFCISLAALLNPLQATGTKDYRGLQISEKTPEEMGNAQIRA